MIEFLKESFRNLGKKLVSHKFSKSLGAFLFYTGYRPKKFHNKGNSIRKFLNILFFNYYHYTNRNLPSREFNKKFWEEFGSEYLETMNKIPIGEFYMKEVCKIISENRVNAVLELGCGFGRHLKFLSEKYPHLELYGIEIVKGADQKIQGELKNRGGVSIIIDDVRNIERYRDILRRVNLIFSYGIFVYLNRADLEHVCRIIKDNFKGTVVYTDAAVGKRIEDLEESIELNSKKYIHPYLKIFDKYHMEQISFTYAESGESFTYVGVQR